MVVRYIIGEGAGECAGKTQEHLGFGEVESENGSLSGGEQGRGRKEKEKVMEVWLPACGFLT
jgi:hypothetical protein